MKAFYVLQAEITLMTLLGSTSEKHYVLNMPSNDVRISRITPDICLSPFSPVSLIRFVCLIKKKTFVFKEGEKCWKKWQPYKLLLSFACE